MRYIQALLIKMIMAMIVLLIILSGFYDYPVGATIGLSILLVVVSYVIGDLAILRMSNNIVATISDLVLATAIIWLLGPFFQGASIPFFVAFISAVFISIGELVFHRYFAQLLNKESIRFR